MDEVQVGKGPKPPKPTAPTTGPDGAPVAGPDGQPIIGPLAADIGPPIPGVLPRGMIQPMLPPYVSPPGQYPYPYPYPQQQGEDPAVYQQQQPAGPTSAMVPVGFMPPPPPPGMCRCCMPLL